MTQAATLAQLASSGGLSADTLGNLTVGGSFTSVNTFGFKNRIINGAMVIDQRNAGAAKSVPVTTITYVLDRWYWYVAGAAINVQQVASGVTGIPYVMQATGAASNTSNSFGTRIESKNIADLAGQTVTISFMAASSVLTSMNLGLYYANTVDNFAAETQIGSNTNFTINSTLTQYSVTVTLPANVANGLDIYFGFGALTSGTFRITNVQLEKGSLATAFDYRPYGTELQLCQRYYERWNFVQFTPLCVVNFNGTNCYGFWTFGVEKRTTPTMGDSSSVSNQIFGNTLNTYIDEYYLPTTKSARFRTAGKTSSALSAAFQSDLIFCTGASGGFMQASAEL